MIDVAVIGAGPAGYVAAVRAAQLGAKVTLIEKDEVGGVCLNKGCIPTKALLESTKALSTIRKAADFGISVEKISLDFPLMMERMYVIVKRLVAGLNYLMKANNIRTIKGTARIIGRSSLEVLKENGSKEIVEARSIIIATGSEPVKPSLSGMTTDEALQLKAIPNTILITGLGVIGVELTFVFNALGSAATLIGEAPSVLPSEDGEIATQIRGIMEKKGITILTKARIVKIDETESGKKVLVATEKEQREIIAEEVLFADRAPNIKNLGLETIGVRVDNGRIVVDNEMKTDVPDVYAAGDVTGGWLAHVAFAEGVVAAENAMGLQSTMDYNVIPRCIFTNPEVASVGLTEEQARARGYSIRLGRFPFLANGRALTLREHEGFVKIVADDKSGEILGVHIIGPRATDLISEAALAIRLEATVQEIANTIHPHPTLSEALKEAALDASDRSIHTVKRKT